MLQAEPLVGSPAPRISHVPTYATTAGDDAVAIARAGGLVLDDAQTLVMREALGETSAGQWASSMVALLAPRQNLKSTILLVRCLLGLFVLGERIVWTSHEFKTSQSSFALLKQIIDSTPAFQSRVKHIRTGNGAESVLTHDGNWVRFIARSKNSGRGLTADVLLLDEAQELSQLAMAALLPTLSAVPNSQVWATGTVPDDQRNDSSVWTKLRDVGRAGSDAHLCWLEWSAAEELVDLDDRSLWAQANSALGQRIGVEQIERERATLTDDDFARERLAIWPSHANSGLFGSGWAELVNSLSAIEQQLSIGVAISIDRTFGCIGVAGLNAEGLLHLEAIDHRRGSGWLVDRVQELLTKHGAAPVVIDGRGPAANLVTAFEDAGIELTIASTSDVTDACADLADRVRDGQVVHLNDPDLNAAVMGAKKRPVGDRWAIGRKTSVSDVSPLEAVLLASIGTAVVNDYDLLSSAW